MSRDLTCNETMPALDDNENLTEVRRLVASRNIGQQMPFVTQFNFNSRGNNSASPMPTNVSHTTTVRDIISSRMRNSKTNDSAIAAFNNSTSTANQASTSSPSSTPYWIKTSSVSVNSNSVDAVNSNPAFQTFMTETTKVVPGRTEVISQPAAGGGSGSKYVTTTSFNHLQNSSMSATIPSHLLVTQFTSGQLASSSSPPSISFSSSSKLGQGVTTYRSSPNVNSSVSAVPIITNNNYNNSATQFSTVRSVTPGGQPMPSNVTSYVIPSSVIGNGNSNIYASAALVQRNSDSPGKILVSRQQLTSASPSPAVLITPFVQQQQPPSRPSSSSYPVTDLSMVRASNASPSKAVPLSSSSAARASTYSVVLPTHSRNEQVVLQGVARESPNGLSNHGSTTPTNSQNPPHSHSSPRPSILRGNSAARRFAEKDLSQGVATNFSSLNFTNTDSGSSGQSIVVNISSSSNVGTTTVLSGDIINDPQFKHISNIVTIPAGNFVFSSSSGEDSLSRHDDSPRKRQRKQQFDNSQLQDKLMMEVRTDPRFDQIPPENAALWKVGSATSSSSSQLPLKSGYSSGGEMATGGGINLSGREPRRRGRPRSINKTPADVYTNSTSNPTPPSSLGSMSYLVTTTLNNSAVGVGQNIQVVVPGTSNVSYLNSPAIAYGTAPPSSSVVQMSTGVGVVGSSANTPANNATPRSFMVDVDSMLQMTSVKRPRKYKKRTPELNPETGEPIKKPRKKGSGRKSKKELLLLEAAKKGIPINYGGTVISGDGILHHQGLTVADSLSSSASSGSRILNTSSVSAHTNVYSSNASGGVVASTPVVATSLSAPAGLIASSVGGKTSHHLLQASQPQQNLLPSVSLFTRLSPEERNVVSTLCKFRSTKPHQAKENISAQQNKAALESKKKEKIEELNEKLEGKESTPEESKPVEYDTNVLLDVNKFSSLRHLWKSHDRTLSNNLADGYDNLINFLAEQKMTNDRYKGFGAASKNASLCSTFPSYEDFKNGLDTLRLLPTACKYARNSKALLASLRANLYGYSAYQLAQNRLASDAEKLTDSDGSVGSNNLLPLSTLKDSLDGVTENCNGFFSRLHKEVLIKLNAPEELGKLKLERDFLVNLDVTEALYDIVDEADRISHEDIGDIVAKTNEWKDGGLNLCESSSENMNPLNHSIATSNGVSTFLAQLPEQYHSVVEKLRPGCQSRRVLPSHKRGRKHLESLSHSEKTTIDEERDCFESELTDNKKAEFILQRLCETCGHSAKQYRNIRRWALRLLERLEPELYAERVWSNRSLNDAVVAGCSSNNCAKYKRLRDHLEDSFLLDIVKGKSTLLPRDTYNPNKSIKMKPSTEQVNNLFKGTYVYGNGDDASTSAKGFCNECRKDRDSAAISSAPSTTNTTSIPSGQQQLPKLIAAERLRETDANYLVMDEINEMEQNAIYTSMTSMALLKKKYADKGDFSNIRGHIKAREPTILNDVATHSYIFNRSLKRRFPSGKTYLEQVEYFNDRCRETHEMAAAAISLSHNRSNLLRQCYESLIELVKHHTKVSSHQCDTNVGVANGNDSDADAEVSIKRSANSNVTHNDNACRDEDADESSASSSDEFDQTSDEDDAAAPPSSHIRKSNTRSPSGGAPNIGSSNSGGIVKKRRWRNKKLAAAGSETSNGDASGGRKTSARTSNRPSPANFR